MKSPVDFFLIGFSEKWKVFIVDLGAKNTCAKFGGEIRNNEAVRTRKHPLPLFFIQY